MGSASSGPKKIDATLYVSPISAPCRAVMMTKCALGLEMEIKHIDLMKQEQLSEEFIKINPDHCVPTLVDHHLTLWESRAVMQYLVDKYAPNHDIYPRAPEKRALIDKMLYIDFGCVYKLVSEFMYPQIFDKKEPNKEKEGEVRKMLERLDKLLEHHQFVTPGGLSIADFSIMANLSIMEAKKWDFTSWVHLDKWRQRMIGLDYYNEANHGFSEFKEHLASQ